MFIGAFDQAIPWSQQGRAAGDSGAGLAAAGHLVRGEGFSPEFSLQSYEEGKPRLRADEVQHGSCSHDGGHQPFTNDVHRGSGGSSTSWAPSRRTHGRAGDRGASHLQAAAPRGRGEDRRRNGWGSQSGNGKVRAVIAVSRMRLKKKRVKANMAEEAVTKHLEGKNVLRKSTSQEDLQHSGQVVAN